MSNYTTAAPVEVSTESTQFFRNWQVAKSEPSLTTNYKTTHVENDDFEYRTRYHNYSLEQLERLEKRKPRFYQGTGSNSDLLFASPNSR